MISCSEIMDGNRVCFVLGEMNSIKKGLRFFSQITPAAVTTPACSLLQHRNGFLVHSGESHWNVEWHQQTSAFNDIHPTECNSSELWTFISLVPRVSAASAGWKLHGHFSLRIQRSCARLTLRLSLSLISHRWYKDEDIPKLDVWGLLFLKSWSFWLVFV